MKKTVSQHAKVRFRERTSLCKGKEMVRLFTLAKQCGKSPDHFAGEFYDFLKARKGHNLKIKVYQEMAFIYKHRNLITVYPVPEQFTPTKEHTVTYFKENNIPDTAHRDTHDELTDIEILKYGLYEIERL